MALEIYPLTIVSDRYDGTYSEARYLAFNSYPSQIPDAIGGGDCEEQEFWSNEANYGIYKIGKVCNSKEEADNVRDKIADFLKLEEIE